VHTSNRRLLLIYRSRKDERLSWHDWLTYSGLFTDISGQQSAVAVCTHKYITDGTERPTPRQRLSGKSKVRELYISFWPHNSWLWVRERFFTRDIDIGILSVRLSVRP